MVNSKAGRKPSERIRQHLMLDPENWEYLRERAYEEQRTLSDQMNWIMRLHRSEAAVDQLEEQ